MRLLDEQTGEFALSCRRHAREATEIALQRSGGPGDFRVRRGDGESYICNAAADPRYVFGPRSGGSSLTVPVRLYDKRIGIFNVESERANAFTERDRQFAEIFAVHLAMGLHTLNLLLVERYTTREDTSGTMQGELSAPLNDLVLEAEYLKEQASENRTCSSTSSGS